MDPLYGGAVSCSFLNVCIISNIFDHIHHRNSYNIIIIIIIITFYSPAQHKTRIQEYDGRLPEKQTLIKLATYLVI